MIIIPYRELTTAKEQFLSSINTVKFELGTEEPVSIQYAQRCQGQCSANGRVENRNFILKTCFIYTIRNKTLLDFLAVQSVLWALITVFNMT